MKWMDPATREGGAGHLWTFGILDFPAGFKGRGE